jgi:hypothetical protein
MAHLTTARLVSTSANGSNPSPVQIQPSQSPRDPTSFWTLPLSEHAESPRDRTSAKLRVHGVIQRIIQGTLCLCATVCRLPAVCRAL